MSATDINVKLRPRRNKGLSALSKILEVKSLSKSIGSAVIVNNASFLVHVRDLTFIIGRSGLGRSILARCINLLERPSGGSIMMDGVEMIDPPTNVNAMRQNIRKMLQSFNLYSHMTAIDNAGLALRKVYGGVTMRPDPPARNFVLTNAGSGRCREGF